MENLSLKLSDAEQRCYAELFASCDTENQGKISGAKASELFLSSQLSTEVLHQITEQCGAKRLGHFGRSQFYIALKLISLAQAGIVPKLELLGSSCEIPLPKFGKSSDSTEKAGGLENKGVPMPPGQLPPPPPTKVRLGIGQRQSSMKSDVESSPSHGPAVVIPPPPATAAGDGSPPPLSPTIPDKGWTAFQNDLPWEEQHHLLGGGTEEDSSDEEWEAYWTITPEQREYYTNQFRSMQSDLKGSISGRIAKEFFEKSKLPVQELSKIWHFSDLDKDGTLTLDEFCIAMHLVVLRRHNINLPEALPTSLLPKPEDKPSTPPTHTSPLHDVASPPNKEWTKFNDSPTSSVSSPSMKPVNFDFSAAQVEQDPLILHPVARRISPDGHALPYTTTDEANDTKVTPVIQRPIPRKHSGGAVNQDPTDTTTYNSYSTAISGVPKKDPPPPPPPRPKYSHTRSSSLDLNRLGQTVPHFLQAPPPTVPPRLSPSMSNAKNESPEFVADFTQLENSQSPTGAFEVYKKPNQIDQGALEEVISIATDDGTALLVDNLEADRKRHLSAPPLALAASNMLGVPRDKKELQSAIKAHRERNTMLTLMHTELSQELSEVMEERIALEIQLEHLKPFS